MSASVTGTLNSIAGVAQGTGVAYEESKGIRDALEKIRYALEHHVSQGDVFEYPHLTTGPAEHILAFSIWEHHTLKDVDTPKPYFSNQGYFADLSGRVLPGSKCATSLQVDATKVVTLYKWPPEQPSPFDQPPSEFANTDPLGHSKQAYFFNDKDSLVTTGPSVPKVQLIKGGGAQLWVASVGVIAQGTGKFKDARGLSSYVGSANFPKWPAAPEEQFKLLAAGFEARITAIFKLILKGDQG
ncbi:MAG TPA: hypothetical protein VGP08_17515 [Pyrinomonadaceae bacterium]|jgi:hypothetical protein|nr:hypothetical protein [Pyrinomonadaceae bacterium]